MTILALSTSTARGSVAILKGAEAAAVSYVDLQGHAERLFHAIDEALAQAAATRASLTGVVCDVGPGSFTGVRVGVASAKGIALGLDLPVAGATSLEAMAFAAFGLCVAPESAVVLAALDAKKSELFVGAYDATGRVVIEPRSCSATAAAITELVTAASLGPRVTLVGEVLAGLALPPELLLARHPALDLPDAVWVGRKGRERLAQADEVEPLYVRPPDATLPARPA